MATSHTYPTFRLVIVAFLGLLLLLPQPGKADFFGKKPPKWVRERPVDGDHYIGIGVARIQKGSTDHVKVAKNNALNDLISEISVTISSNSVLRQFEDETSFVEEFKAETSTSVRQNIDGFELVDSWGKKDEYWVYYRLSKSLYARQKKERIDKAVREASGYYDQGATLEKDLDLNGALSFYLKGLKAVQPYLDEDLNTFLLGQGRVDMGAALFSAVQNIFSRVNIKPEKELLETKISAGFAEPLNVTATFQQEDGTVVPVPNLGLRAYFSKGGGDLTERVQTGQNGVARYTVVLVQSKQALQEITLTLDLEDILGDDESLVEKMVLSKGSPPAARVSVRVMPLVAYFEWSEVHFGESADRSQVGKGIKKSLSELSFSFTQDKAASDVVVEVKAEAFEGEYLKDHDVYKVYMDVDISIINPATGTKVYYKHIDQERGMQVKSYTNALKAAQQNAIERIKEEVIPEIDALQL